MGFFSKQEPKEKHLVKLIDIYYYPSKTFLEVKRKIVLDNFDNLFKYRINGDVEEFYCNETISNGYIFDFKTLRHLIISKESIKQINWSHNDYLIDENTKICDIIFHIFKSKSKTFPIENFYVPVNSKNKRGVIKVCIGHGFEEIKKGEILFSIDYNEESVNNAFNQFIQFEEEMKKKEVELKIEKERKMEHERIERQEKIDQLNLQIARNKLILKQRKKEIEKIAKQQLIDEGIIDNPNDEELKVLRKIEQKRNKLLIK